MKTNGYFKLHRSIWINPVVMKDAHYFITWMYIMSQAEFQRDKKVDFGGKTIELKQGQFTIGIKNQMLSDLRMVTPDLSISKLYRIIRRFKSETQIETLTDGKCTLITVVNWEERQKSETQNETQMKNKWKSNGNPATPNEVSIKNNNKENNTVSPSADSDEEKDPYAGLSYFELQKALLREQGIEWNGYEDDE